jgi:hypothetical protein
MSKIDVTTKLAATEASLKRWQTRLKRAVTKVSELDRQRRRYQLMLTLPNAPTIVVESIVLDDQPSPQPGLHGATAVLEATKKKLDIPAFLDRADPHIAAKMTAARKAKEAEKRKEMPLTGKAALAKIKERK